jgi:mRNA interferase RelE/StbE
MHFEIILAAGAVDDLRRLEASDRARVRAALEQHLRFEPTRTSRSRIKCLRGLARPQFRLRVDDIRVFYDMTEGAVEVLAILSKSDAEAWLDRVGIPNEEDPPLGNQE